MKAPASVAEAERLLATGDWQGAAAVARACLTKDPGNSAPVFVLADALLRGRQPDKALKALERLPRSERRTPRRLMLEGRARNNLGQLKLAEKTFKQLLKLEPGNADACSNLGHVIRGLGRPREAEQQLRRAVELNPCHARALQTLADIRLAADATEEAVELLRQALDTESENPGLLAHLGVALHRSGDFAGAETAYRAALAADPGHAEAWLNLGITLQDTGRLNKAVAAYLRAASVAPASITACVRLSEALLARGDTQQALDEIERGQRIDPSHPSLLAAQALALTGLGRSGEAATLLDPSRLLMSVDLAPPPGYDSIGSFNAALTTHLLKHPTLAYEPDGHATRKGRHTGNLLGDNEGPMAHLEQAAQAAANDYLKRLAPDPERSFPGAVPGRHQLTMWAVVMDTAGHQLPHIHPAAWLSGVYYVELPPTLGDGQQSHDGWIEFGLPPEEFHQAAVPEVHAFEPVAGRMYLFPSYFYHRTLPFPGPARRISIAFDFLRRTRGV